MFKGSESYCQKKALSYEKGESLNTESENNQTQAVNIVMGSQDSDHRVDSTNRGGSSIVLTEHSTSTLDTACISHPTISNIAISNADSSLSTAISSYTASPANTARSSNTDVNSVTNEFQNYTEQMSLKDQYEVSINYLLTDVLDYSF